MDLYLTLKTLHLIAVVCWFAGLFYLPRLFVYMVEAPKAAPTLHIMARKLSLYITFPAGVATWVFGLSLLANQPYLAHAGWLHAKLGLVLILTAYNVSLEYHRRTLAAGKNQHTGRYFRMYNEVPTLCLILIVALAVFKPF
ncbi:MAG: protoporphyrinogen oxidase HemJ [Proteobacteria bacterium]|nr:protoporphyrinogen oxidase HemJ [Pseudomonadota bacterium]